MQEFRQKEELVKWANRVMKSPNWKILMETMFEEHPMNAVPNVVYPEHTDSKRLGVIEGYNLFRNTLETAKEPVAPPTELVPTFANPEKEDADY